MANNTANTAWKLTDLYNITLFEFDSSNGWHPTNENHTVELTNEEYNIPWDNLVQRIDYGLGKRMITLQGVDVADKDVWVLSSTIAKRQLMKLWLGEDWWFYVLGVEPRQIRDESLPYQKSYNVSFNAVDPHYYFSNSAEGSDSGVDWVVPSASMGTAWSSDISTATIDLTGTGADEGTTDLEPVFWFIGGSSTAITAVLIIDKWSRSLIYTPTSTIEDGDVHVIMPYRNTAYEGFMVNDVTGFKVLNGTANAALTEPDGTMGGAVSASGTWAFDIFSAGAGTEDGAASNYCNYAQVTEEVPCKITLNGTAHIDKNRLYPLALDKLSNTFTCTGTGTTTDCKYIVQYCVRRV